jgi:Rieske Fe-S protein
VHPDMAELAETAMARRAALLAMGATGLAAVAGCASYGGDSAGQASAPPPQQPQKSGTVLGAAADVPVGGGKVFADQQVVVTQPAKGTFEAFSVVCPHQGCAVDEVKNGTINCPCHGSKFRVADGAVAAGPAKTGLAKKSVTVAGDKITLA